MDLDLKGKTALVTGGTAGIGLAIVESLAAEGAIVTVPGRNHDKLNKVGGRIRGVHTVVADASTVAGVEAIIEMVPDIDILINNLGVYEPRNFEDISDFDWLMIFETNVLGGVRLSRHYFPRMLARNCGRVIFISSESGVMTPPEIIHYGVTKSAQLAISRGLAERTKGTNVTVNSVLPGPTRSEGIVGFLEIMSSIPNATAEQAEQEFFKNNRQSSLLQRLIGAGEIASLVTFLASPLSSATNGAALRAEGGLLRSIV